MAGYSYIVQDDPEQSLLATKFIEAKCTTKSPGYINIIVLCEIVWVLRRAYNYNKSVITNVLSKLLSLKELIVERSAEVSIALKEYKNGNADFVDYLIGVINNQKGCDLTYTLDKKAAMTAHFKLL